MSNYVDKHLNEELKEYFKVFSTSYPHFLDKYIDSLELQRLSTIGQFCGCDYTKLYNIKYWYSRLDHSIVTALMAWNFTKDKKQTIAALFHDLGTPAFSHCIDYLLGDTTKQETSERDIADFISNSDKLKEYLELDDTTIEDIISLEKYTVLENKKPKLCVDRLEGVLHTGLIWRQFWQLEDIRSIYSNIIVLKNEDKEDEIGFKDINSAFKFFEGVYKYSMVLQQNENKFALQFISDCIKYLIDCGRLNIDDLYKYSEKEIVELFTRDIKLSKSWDIFSNTEQIKRSSRKPNVEYFVSVDTKKRYVVPLCMHNGKIVRLNTVSKECKNLLDDYMNYKDSKYAYIKNDD